MDLEYLRASDGEGPAAPATVTVARSASATQLQVNATTNWPNKFIGTYGVLNNDTKQLEVASVRVITGHLDGPNVIIDSFAPGFIDNGNSVGDKLFVKPASEFANRLVDFLLVSHEANGNLKQAVIDAIESEVLTGTGTLTNKRLKPRVYSTNTTTTLTPDLSTHNVFVLTGLEAALTIANPTGTPSDGEVIVFRLKDNGTARGITWGNAFVGIGDSLLGATVANKWHYANAMYNAASAKWDVLPAITQG